MDTHSNKSYAFIFVNILSFGSDNSCIFMKNVSGVIQPYDIVHRTTLSKSENKTSIILSNHHAPCLVRRFSSVSWGAVSGWCTSTYAHIAHIDSVQKWRPKMPSWATQLAALRSQLGPVCRRTLVRTYGTQATSVWSGLRSSLQISAEFCVLQLCFTLNQTILLKPF